MPSAGFFAEHVSEIRFGSDGVWYADGEPIANQRIQELFSRSVERTSDGAYILRIGNETCGIQVDDTPFVICDADVAPGGVLTVSLSDGSRETVKPGSLRVGAENVLYCQVKGGAERARFLRAAYYRLAAHLCECQPGRFVLQVGDAQHPIKRD